MNEGVLYVMEGTKLAARLVVSLSSLRKHYDGPVTVASGDSRAAAVCDLLVADRRLGVAHISIDSPTRIRAHRGYLLKTLVNRFSPYQVTAFLDCDTLVRGPIDELFSLPSDEHILATRFCNWGTATGIVAKRIRGWTSIRPNLIRDALSFGAAVNTGVFSFTARTKIFERWFEVALAGQDCFIPDEIGLQLLLPHYPHVIVDDRFNCSAKFGKQSHPETRIIHFHGRKHVGQYGTLWLAAYSEAISANIASIRNWTPALDRQLATHLRSRKGSKA